MSEELVTLTRAGLSEAVYAELGVSKTECAGLVDSMLEHIVQSLLDGERVKIIGFGVFAVRDKGARVGRNPKTGEIVTVTARRVLVFKAGSELQDRVESGMKIQLA